VTCALLLVLALAQGQAPSPLTPEERKVVLELSPLPELPRDPTNAWSGNPEAARLGQALFYDTRLSGTGTISCATCHDPARSWTDGLPLARATLGLSRHTMTLWNVAYNRWFFWDGRKDSLWSQALGPFEDRREQASSRLAVLHTLAGDERLSAAYERLFGPLPALGDRTRFPAEGLPMPEEPEHPLHRAWTSMTAQDQEAATRAFVNLGKAIAAFEEQLISRDAPFDRYVAALREGDAGAEQALPAAARRGLRLFIGKARCVICHDGPNFTDLEFHDNRVPLSEEGADPGRKLGIRRLKKDPFNSLGPYADDGGASGRLKLGFLVDDSHSGRLFKTPTLRNIARTAPYMHEGQFATLAEVVAFYSSLEGAAPPNPFERTLHPLDLDAGEQADLVAFLESLTDEKLPPALLGPP